MLVLIAVTDAAVAKNPPPPKKRVVKGTTQLKGDQAKFGLTYTLGKGNPINVTLNSAEYTVAPVRFGNQVLPVNADEKMLVLHYTLHNPNPRDFRLSWHTVEINAVDSYDTNWRYVATTAVESTGEECNTNLKPGQKIKIYTAIKVPAKGEIPKVMFEQSQLVLRYDLLDKLNKVKPLSLPIADPNDPTGATALEKVPAQMGIFYPLRMLEGRVDSATFIGGTINGRQPRKGNRFLVIACTAKNRTPSNFGFRWSTFSPKLVDTDGSKLAWSDGDIYLASRDDPPNAEMEPGQEFHFRFVYQVPTGATLQTFSIRQSSTGREYAYDFSQVQ
jgi:hypothetical protein